MASEQRMTTNRSSEELEMRQAVEAWGRARLPGCRVMHELAVNSCRIDLAFVGDADLIGVEIKSSRDTLDRLDRQWDEFNYCLPEVWLAVAPKYAWGKRPPGGKWIANEIVVDGATIVSDGTPFQKKRGADRNWHVLSAMPMILHVAENRRILDRYQIKFPKNAPQRVMQPLIARHLTGDQIMREVCIELRSRSTGWIADAPIERVA